MKKKTDIVIKESGFSVIELLATFVIVTVLIGILAYDFKALNQPALSGAAHFAGFVKRARAKALATTYAYTINPSRAATAVTTTYANTCGSEDQTEDSALTLTLPDTAAFEATDWSICFSPRGISEDSATVTIHDGSDTHTIEIAAGGGVRYR